MKDKTKQAISVKKIDRDVQEQLRRLVVARLQSVPSNLKISVGSQEHTREQLIKSVEEGDETGRQLMESQLEYLRDLASGKIYQKTPSK